MKAVGGQGSHQIVENAMTGRHTATHCNTLQHTATRCNTLQHTATLVETAIVENAVRGFSCNRKDSLAIEKILLQ